MTSETVTPMTETAWVELNTEDLDQVAGGLPAVQSPNARKAGSTPLEY